MEGVPRAQGSMTAGVTRDGRPYIRHSNNSMLEWRRTVAERARDELLDLDLYDETFPLEGPLYLNLIFWMPRPQSHYFKSGNLRPDAPEWHAIMPDKDKLIRAVFDALTMGGVWHDDKQVSDGHYSKKYIEESCPPGVDITLYKL